MLGDAVSLASNGPKIPALIYMADVTHQEESGFLPLFPSSSRLFMSALSFTPSTMKDCKNRRRDQRRSRDSGEEKEFISDSV